MAVDRLEAALAPQIQHLDETGASKRRERVILDVVPPAGMPGTALILDGEGDRPVHPHELQRLSRSLSCRGEIKAAEDEAVSRYGRRSRRCTFHQRHVAARMSSWKHSVSRLFTNARPQ